MKRKHQLRLIELEESVLLAQVNSNNVIFDYMTLSISVLNTGA